MMETFQKDFSNFGWVIRTSIHSTLHITQMWCRRVWWYPPPQKKWLNWPLSALTPWIGNEWQNMYSKDQDKVLVNVTSIYTFWVNQVFPCRADMCRLSRIRKINTRHQQEIGVKLKNKNYKYSTLLSPVGYYFWEHK